MNIRILVLALCLSVSYYCMPAAADIVTQQLEDGGTALVVSGTAYTADEQTALNENVVVELWKTGTTTLISDGISSYNGIIRVKQGILSVASQAGLGNTAGATYVESGATLEQTDTSTLFAEPVYLEGAGMDNKGAYFASNNTAKKSPGFKGGPVTLTGNALLVGQRQWYLQPSELDMRGYTMTLSNVNHQCVFKPAKITEPGHILVTMGTLWVNNGAKFDGTAENTLTLTNNSTMSFYGYKTLNSAPWKIIYATKNTGNTFYISNTSSSSPSHWYGPVEVLAGYTIRTSLVTGSSDGGWHEFWGTIIGEGGLSVVNGNKLEGVRLYGTNTYEGVTSIPDSGQLWFMHRKAMPSTDPTKFTLPANTGRMYLPLREDGSTEEFVGWTASELKEVHDGFDAGNATRHPFRACIAAGNTFTYPFDFDAAKSSYSCRHRYAGGGTVKYTGDFIGRPKLALEADADDGTTLVIDGSGEGRVGQYGGIDFYDGKFLLKNIPMWFTSEQDDMAAFNVNVFSTSPKSRVTFGEGVTMCQKIRRVTEDFNICYGGDAKCGVVEFLDGCTFTNHLKMAYTVDQAAAVYQRGGDVYLTNGGGNDGHVGYGGYGFYEKTGGSLAIRAWTRLGVRRYGVGIFHMSSDWTMEDSSFAVTSCGTGVVYQTAGTFSVPSSEYGSLTICNANYASSQNGGHGELTVKGPDACVHVANDTFYMADTSLSESFVNLIDGGTMRIAQLRKSGEKAYRTGNDISNAAAYVSFSGGVLKSTGMNANLFGVGVQSPDRVTVFAAGAVIDTDAYTVTNGVPLQAPTGKGIASITLPEDFDATGYVGAPVVIIDGDGTGATAVCEFDSQNQVVTGITVTSPGWGYTSATASIARGGKTNAVACAVSLADNATTGGLTKRGAGRLVLAAANTYGGQTRIEGGVLETAAEGAIPAASEIVFAGGALAIGAGLPVPAEATVDLAAYGAGETVRGNWPLLSVSEGSHASVPVVHGLEPGWIAAYSGRTLMLRRINGLTISVR